MTFRSRLEALERSVNALSGLLPTCPNCGARIGGALEDPCAPPRVLDLATPGGEAELEAARQRVAELDAALSAERFEELRAMLPACPSCGERFPEPAPRGGPSRLILLASYAQVAEVQSLARRATELRAALDGALSRPECGP